MFENRYSGVLVVDVSFGNPNGDPDAGNKPRQNPLTGKGQISNHALKRKMRDTIKTMFGSELYVEHGDNLTDVQKGIMSELGVTKNSMSKPDKDTGKFEDRERFIDALVDRFIDIRIFGAVATQASTFITGPVQVTDAFSVDVIHPISMTVTCCAGSGESKGDSDDKDRTKNMGNRWVVPYGLYVAHIDITPTSSRNNKCTEEDIEMLFKAIERMFDLHKTSTSGEQVLRKFVLFKHASPLGDQPCHELYNSVKINKICDGEPTSFDDYEITIDRDAVNTDKIEIIERV